MAITAIADIIVPEVLADQVAAKFPDKLVIGNSRLVDSDSSFALGSPGTTFTIPFWKRIGVFGNLTEGTAMTPGKIQAAKENAIVMRGGAAYEVYDTAQLVSKADPVGEISEQISTRAAQYLDAKLVDQLDRTPNTYDQTGNGAGTLEPNAIITALITALGDNYSEMVANGALIMHSKPYGDLLKLGVIQNNYQSNMDVLMKGTLGSLLGLPIIVSDRVTTAVVSGVTHYNTYIVGPGALGLFFQRQVLVEFDRDILLQADVIAATVHFSPHLYGWDDVGNAQAYEDAKSIRVVKIKSK